MVEGERVWKIWRRTGVFKQSMTERGVQGPDTASVEVVELSRLRAAEEALREACERIEELRSAFGDRPEGEPTLVTAVTRECAFNVAGEDLHHFRSLVGGPEPLEIELDSRFGSEALAERDSLQAQVEEAREALEEIVEVSPHATYAENVQGDGYRGACHDCSWTGTYYPYREGAKDAARAEGVAHAVEAPPVLELKEGAVFPPDFLPRLSPPTEGK